MYYSTGTRPKIFSSKCNNKINVQETLTRKDIFNLEFVSENTSKSVIKFRFKSLFCLLNRLNWLSYYLVLKSYSQKNTQYQKWFWNKLRWRPKIFWRNNLNAGSSCHYLDNISENTTFPRKYSFALIIALHCKSKLSPSSAISI